MSEDIKKNSPYLIVDWGSFFMHYSKYSLLYYIFVQ